MGAKSRLTMKHQSEPFQNDLERSPQQLRNLLDRPAGRVHLTITRNRVSMVSVKFDLVGRIRVRLNHSFLSAPNAVVAALGTYLQTR